MDITGKELKIQMKGNALTKSMNISVLPPAVSK